MIYRDLQNSIEKWIWKGKILVIYWPRRVGKTTLAKSLLKKYGNPRDYLDADQLDVRQSLESQNKDRLKSTLGNTKFIVIDEAQRVRNIGLNLKILVDNFPEIQIIATWSSSFDLAQEINESLTGRQIEFHLWGISIAELGQLYSRHQLNSKIPDFLRFGMYPDSILSQDYTLTETLLRNIASNYLYKDVLEHENIKKPDLLVRLLQALALQVGNQVSDNELATLLGVGRATILRYIDLLEKSFVIFRLPSFARNLRNELKFSKKIYFYDVGIRNALISQFQPIELRSDIGWLWENFLISERYKHLQNHLLYRNTYFWRSHTQAEIDYIEEYNGKLSAYEFKWGEKPIRIPKAFRDAYPESQFLGVNRHNFSEFIQK